MKTVLFACVHNAGRSQMAAALFNAFVDPKKATAISAGTEPAKEIHPEVIDVMREVGIDLSQLKPQKLTDELAQKAQMLITMGCGEACPVVVGILRDDWSIPDPKGKSLEAVRFIREEIAKRVFDLLQKQGWASQS
ncbi:MAG: arsenate reductase [Deltaproteobacteria bacterium RIFCSPLOWO2_01_44_7]|nr:MAG: arsenate reductase [Deltaproteobacteria bacterium RIFCSPHIGHO2_01_FULL_43_49]OGQ16287.1 MAG: arsenate reductase [Deltaproteobacteria bacterium RIFCSPHIGHO2_02_FULL_44_53]OGQ29247.1 MAG: arsenate reductase [Deltaproteobacteria bacterium RIFCSPHIGHO2_12_FULL_44_21]OGQ32804.1 MAG: arsenate reductase [Deltaproteobacteria bacterium RIFCSPLOWO2_01_FULL_45_74]OGQ41454.1 MAG: arsenate reductase [Deltaproteobacteria bacterium RIFCSPLOWO2_01_44_7]OGQ41905.1 MAG: arsenate reductase [Deltaproteoba